MGWLDPIRSYVGAGMHRRIFCGFGASILLAVLVTSAVWRLGMVEGRSFHDEVARLKSLVARQFAESWNDPAARDSWARAIAEELEIGLVLRDNAGTDLGHFGSECAETPYQIDVVGQDGASLGSVAACDLRHHHGLGLAAFGAAGLTLWFATGWISRRLVRPLRDVSRVAEEIGQGKLSSRVALDRHSRGELGTLAESINTMAKRIERQIADQRELLAAVSHELRTPLGHMRVVIDIARDQGTPCVQLDTLEAEVMEADRLIDELLASSRVEFSSLEFSPHRATRLAERALERAGLPTDVFEVEGQDLCIQCDATLLSRALANLFDNAVKHGGGVKAFRVREQGEFVVFEVEDAGPGFDCESLTHAFESFYRGRKKTGSSLGLGLALVRRIALAHGGEAKAENLAGGGARLSLTLAKAPRKVAV